MICWRIWEIQNWDGHKCDTAYIECYFDLNQLFHQLAALTDYDRRWKNKIKMEVREEQVNDPIIIQQMA